MSKSKCIFCHGCKKFFEKPVCVCVDEEEYLFACPDCVDKFKISEKVRTCTICNKQFFPSIQKDRVTVGGYCFCRDCIVEVVLTCGTETISDLIDIAESEDPEETKKKKTLIGMVKGE